MKIILSFSTFILAGSISFHVCAQTKKIDTSAQPGNAKNLYIDVHQLTPGKVKFEEVAAAHLKDLAVEKKYDVHFINYWVDEEKGLVYCLSSAGDSSSIRKTHAEAHGLLPDHIFKVTEGSEATLTGNKKLFLDIHELGAGNVTSAAVADAHKKDLAVQGKYGVNFINYWVDEKAGVVMCLSEAADSNAIIATHKEAHGLIPVEILRVKQGQ
ncbi:MAG: hypothetical protein JWR61_4707 [Ferruginibacter sp.]|uniref:DUF4242 domain-containing protein n=1 Tax=Ferruginibacter sp. TaxID=1940288 RepID=UPI00265B347C|nr:DUF4242 domain-containing protein [Ferruginibacter sp.]MDB5279752.1 hypothetical protein [Ferruginibacter sp.]